MITIERVTNPMYGRSHINTVSGPNPELHDPMKPPETPAAPTVPDNDAEIASVHANSLRGKLAEIQGNLHRNGTYTNAFQNYRQLLALLMEKREQIREQIKELAQLERKKRDRKAQQEALWKKIDAFKQQINEFVNKANFDGNKIFTAAGQDIAISLGNEVVVKIPAKDFGASPTDVDLSEKPDVLLEKEDGAIQSLMDYDEFLRDVEKKIGSSTTLMEFELSDILKVEERTAEKNMTLELAKFTVARIREEMRQALQSQAHVSSAATMALLLNAN